MIPTSTVLAIRCPECGKIEYLSISLFSFSHESSITLKCSCKIDIVTVSTKKRKDFWIYYFCAMCEDWHLLKMSRRQLWFNPTAFDLVCEETGMEVGYIGPREEVLNKIQKQNQSLAEMAEQLGFTEYFNNSFVMYEILEHIYSIAETGNLYCTCGNQNVEVDIFPEHIELSCGKCKIRGKIKADKEEDIQAMKRIWELKLTRNGFLFNQSEEDYNKHKN